MTIILSTGLSAIALAILAHHREIGDEWRAGYGLAALCCCAGCVVAGFVVAFFG